MSKPGHGSGPVIVFDESKRRVIELGIEDPAADHLVYCAYNGTREQLLAANVELVDLPPETLYDRLASLGPEAKTALWLNPFHGISPDQVAYPIDLVYLDRNYCVLEVIRSFPLSLPTSLGQMAETVLALPAQAIASSGTVARDQLILCSPQKLKRRLRTSALLAYISDHSSAPPTASVEEPRREDLPEQNPLTEQVPIQAPSTPVASPIASVKKSRRKDLPKQNPRAKQIPIQAPSTPVAPPIASVEESRPEDLPEQNPLTEQVPIQAPSAAVGVQAPSTPVAPPIASVEELRREHRTEQEQKPLTEQVPVQAPSTPVVLPIASVGESRREDLSEQNPLIAQVPIQALSTPVAPPKASVEESQREDLPKQNPLTEQVPIQAPSTPVAPPIPSVEESRRKELPNQNLLTEQVPVQAPSTPVAPPIASVAESGREDLPKQNPLIEQVPIQAPSTPVAPKQMRKGVSAGSETTPKIPEPKKSWLAQWWEAPDPRYSPRESLPMIVAYFFNGGAPVPTPVRDISLDGMFLCTSERWYLGTVLRVTLSDRRMPTVPRSIVLNAMAVRSDEGGVGFSFIFRKEKWREQKQRRGASYLEDNGPLVNVTRNQFKQFLSLIKDDPSSLLDANGEGISV